MSIRKVCKMPAQPTPGKWLPKRIPDNVRSVYDWGVVIESIPNDIYIAVVHPVYDSWGKKRTRRNLQEEQANAYLLAQAKNMARALLQLQQVYENADEDGIKTAWEYAESVLEAAKVPEA